MCKFCGVSYLVFSEIKELEKRLEKSETKLRQYKDKISQYEALKEQVSKLERLALEHVNESNQHNAQLVEKEKHYHNNLEEVRSALHKEQLDNGQLCAQIAELKQHVKLADLKANSHLQMLNRFKHKNASCAKV